MKPTLLILAFTAGFVDTASFIGAGGIFSAHVTGNFVLFAAALVQGATPADYLKLLTLPLFLVGVACVGVVIQKLQLKDGRLEQLLGLLQGCLLLLAGALSYLGVAPFMVVTVLVFAMATQNVLQKMVFTGSPTTTVMTGNMTTLGLEATATLLTPLKSTKITPIFQVALSFLVGCAVATYLTQVWGTISVVPVGVLLIMHFRGAQFFASK